MSTVAELLPPALRRAVSPYTGIVRTLEECLSAAADPPVHRVAVAAGRGLAQLAGSGGAGMTRAEAAAAAVGEAIERYALSTVPLERIFVASASELGDEAVTPERFALFSERQHAQPGFPFAAFTRTARVPWVDGLVLPHGEHVWVPAELVFLSDLAVDGERIGYATSSGAACAATRDEALERGLCELLERDAFMITWANRLELPLLDWRGDEKVDELDRALFAPTGLRYSAVDLSVFHRLPSVLGVVRAPDGYAGALGVGAGTAVSSVRAWWKALVEAFAARSAGAKLALRGGGDVVGTFEDHIRRYAEPRPESMFLDASVRRSRIADVPRLPGAAPADRVTELCERVEAAGSNAYAVDVTSTDIRALGLVVMKVVAPELCALDVVHGARFLGGRRLYEAAWRLGLRPEPLRESDVNPHPHPFP